MSEQPPFEPYRPEPVARPDGPPDPAQQRPYGQSPYSAPMYGHPPYGGYGVPVQDHPQATTVLVLGIASVFFTILGPVAWVLGSRAKREIEASGGRLGGMSQVQVGYIIGIITTVLMAVTLLAVVVIFVTAFGLIAAGS